MARLNSNMAQQVHNAEDISEDFEPLAPGKYAARLMEVEQKMSNAGDPMWVATFSDLINVETGEKAPGRQWYNMLLPADGPMPANYQPRNPNTDPASAWEFKQNMAMSRLRKFFEAFGEPTDTDTDVLLGERCAIRISVRTIQYGERKGERTNSVEDTLPLDDPSKYEQIDNTGYDSF